jgi:hypothetical protein
VLGFTIGSRGKVLRKTCKKRRINDDNNNNNNNNQTSNKTQHYFIELTNLRNPFKAKQSKYKK